MKTTKLNHCSHKVNKYTFLIKPYACQSHILLRLGHQSCLTAKFLEIGKIKVFDRARLQEKNLDLKLKFSDYFRAVKKIQVSFILNS